MMSECSGGAADNTCKGVLYQHIIVSKNKINSMNTYTMPVFHKLKIQIIIDVTHPRLLDAEGTGGTLTQNVCIC